MSDSGEDISFDDMIVGAAPAAESDSDTSNETPRHSLQLPRGTGRELREWMSPDEWRITLEEASNVSLLRSPSDVSIFRVPGFLKKGKSLFYVPQIVSLGPYHHRNAELSPMDKHKGRALVRMMTRFNLNHNKDPASKEFSYCAVKEILKLEDDIRKTYEEKIDCDGEIVARMLSLDGCFILEILRTLGKKNFPVPEASNHYEPVFEKNKIDYTGLEILCDILMLENQIPLRILRKLLELELKSTDNVESKLFKVLVKFPRSKLYPFKCDMKEWSWPAQQQQVAADGQIHHLLDLLHNLIVSPPFCGDGASANQTISGGPKKVPLNVVRRIRRAVELRNAGIKFGVCKGGIKNIKFVEESATICLPPIQITDYTEVLFRNLIALELCKASEINYVTSYLSLMDELIDSEEDVGVLIKSKIVTNYLGSDAEAADLFNGLCNGVTLSRKDAFQELKGRVYKHYNSKLKVWSAEFVKEHVSSPWRCFALAGAILALLLTALQTVYTIIGVYK